ncbi:TSUP family transporter [Actinomadura sp. NTSP31]|uniref:TSUP family transporter n=1 Tax=Actinomadura sp. NTSP31 TaxID=1735447 RepID=UPI0035C1DC9C
MLVLAMFLAFALAWLSAMGGVGGSVLTLLAFTALFGLQTALPVLALTQLAGNGGRVWFNRRDVQWRIIGRFAAGAVPAALAGAFLLPYAPVGPLKRCLGAWLVAMLVLRRCRPAPRPPADGTFTVIGAGTGLGSSLLGSAGPLAAPFFLARGLTGGAYIGTEATASLTVHLSKVAAYGTGGLLPPRVLHLGLVLAPAVIAGAWCGKRTVARMSPRAFALVIETGMVIAAVSFLAGL